MEAQGWRFAKDPLRGGEPGRDLGGTTDAKSRRYAALAYALGAFSGVVVLFVKREDRFVQFHALQSIAATVVGLVLAFILWVFSYFPIFGFLYEGLFRVFKFAVLILWVVAIVQAYRGAWFRMPRLGPWVERQML